MFSKLFFEQSAHLLCMKLVNIQQIWARNIKIPYLGDKGERMQQRINKNMYINYVSLMSGLWLPHDLIRKHYLERLKKDVFLTNTENVLLLLVCQHLYSKHPESTFSISGVFLRAKGFLCRCCPHSTCVTTTTSQMTLPPSTQYVLCVYIWRYAVSWTHISSFLSYKSL